MMRPEVKENGSVVIAWNLKGNDSDIVVMGQYNKDHDLEVVHALTGKDAQDLVELIFSGTNLKEEKTDD